MPLFEYRCGKCGKKVALLVGVVASTDTEKCPNCGSTELTKLVSRFKHAKDESARIDEMADRLEMGGEPESPSEMRALVREMGKAMDDDFSDDMEEMFEGDMEGKGDEFGEN